VRNADAGRGGGGIPPVVLHHGSRGRDPVSSCMRFKRERLNQCVRVDRTLLTYEQGLWAPQVAPGSRDADADHLTQLVCSSPTRHCGIQMGHSLCVWGSSCCEIVLFTSNGRCGYSPVEPTERDVLCCLLAVFLPCSRWAPPPAAAAALVAAVCAPWCAAVLSCAVPCCVQQHGATAVPFTARTSCLDGGAAAAAASAGRCRRPS
jgi:hypothetical protein